MKLDMLGLILVLLLSYIPPCIAQESNMQESAAIERAFELIGRELSREVYEIEV